jgi:hypothetical protein
MWMLRANEYGLKIRQSYVHMRLKKILFSIKTFDLFFLPLFSLWWEIYTHCQRHDLISIRLWGTRHVLSMSWGSKLVNKWWMVCFLGFKKKPIFNENFWFILPSLLQPMMKNLYPLLKDMIWCPFACEVLGMSSGSKLLNRWWMVCFWGLKKILFSMKIKR